MRFQTVFPELDWDPFSYISGDPFAQPLVAFQNKIPTGAVSDSFFEKRLALIIALKTYMVRVSVNRF